MNRLQAFLQVEKYFIGVRYGWVMRYTEEEIKAIWLDFFATTDYGKEIIRIPDQYPDVRSLYVNYDDIVTYSIDHADGFAEDILEHPDVYLEIGEMAISEYLESSIKVHLRISHIPEKDRIGEIRKLRTAHLGKFVSIRGIIRRATEIRPRLKVGAFRCSNCGGITKVIQESMRLTEPIKCAVCGKTKPKVKFKLEFSESVFEDYQVVEIQDMPESLRGGEQPQRITAILEDDIAAMVVPGDRVILNGILRAKEYRVQNVKSTEFRMYLDVNSVDKEPAEEAFYENLTDEDIEEIKALASEGNVIEKLRDSIAPTIYDMEVIKEALVLQMFGGVSKHMPDGTKIRGDIHVLLVGDPGTAKSQLLQRMADLAPRGIYTSGKGSSAAGLTATAVRDDSGRWTLEAGALVLADQGLAAIDEIDKMSATDRDSIYQAMEQQIITVTKAGIYATLMSRCSILGAANPKYGRFDRESPGGLADQIDLPVPLLSRFDVIFKVLDVPDKNRDREMAEYILRVHLAGEKLQLGEEDVVEKQHIQKIPPELIRKYVMYAKKYVFPKLSDEAMQVIEKEYLEMRGMYEKTGRIAVTPRQLEAMIRLAEASARARLSDVVTAEDASRAVRIVKHYLLDVSSENGVIDADIISTGMPTSKREKISRIKHIIAELSETKEYARMSDIVRMAMDELGCRNPEECEEEVEEYIGYLRQRGEVILDKRGGYKLVRH